MKTVSRSHTGATNANVEIPNENSFKDLRKTANFESNPRGVQTVEKNTFWNPNKIIKHILVFLLPRSKIEEFA